MKNSYSFLKPINFQEIFFPIGEDHVIYRLAEIKSHDNSRVIGIMLWNRKMKILGLMHSAEKD